MNQTLNGRPSLIDRSLFSPSTKQPTPTVAHRRQRQIRQVTSTRTRSAPSMFELRSGPAFATEPLAADERWEGTQVLRASDVDGQGGLYIIVHAPTGQRYTGCSKNIGQRYRQHATSLRTLLHHCRPMLKIWLTTSPAEWVFAVVAVGPATVDDESRAIWQAGALAFNKPAGGMLHILYPSIAADMGILPDAWK